MAKVWTYTPNEYTTGMTFTVSFTDGGSPAVFIYRLVGETWTLVSGSDSGLSTGGENAVSIVDNGRVKKIQCLCFNSSASNEAQSIDVKRVVILDGDDIQHGRMNYVVRGLLNDSQGISPWDNGKIPAMGDITFTNLTESAVVNEHETNYQQFVGIAIINPTAKPAINSPTSKQLKAIWVRRTNNCDSPWYEIPATDTHNQLVNCDFTSLKEIPYPDSGLFAFPVVEDSGVADYVYDATIHASDNSEDYDENGLRTEASLRAELNPNAYNNN